MVCFDGLNDAQRAAVTSTAPVILCLAGAGSGKTRVLTHRIAWLHEEHRVGTGSMLALTFTRLAAKEMRDRLQVMIGEEAVKDLFVGTFHAWCAYILHQYHASAGLDENFSIWDEEDRDDQIRAIIEELQYKNVKVADVVTALKNPGTDIWTTPAGLVAKEYEWRLRQNNAVDLDGLLAEVNMLFMCPWVGEELRQKYQYVFVDEFQDTDNMQMALLEHLAPANLFVVGDDFQAIYGWRGANIHNILNFGQSYGGAEVHRLEDNYRSTHQIVAAANNLIAHNEHQHPKTLRAHRGGPAPIIDDEAGDEEAECARIVQHVSALRVAIGYAYSDIAVLARTNRQVDQIAAALENAGIPCLILGRHKDPFADHDIRALLSWLEVVNNPGDGYHLRRVIRQSVGELELTRLEARALRERATLWDLMAIAPEDSPLRTITARINEIYQTVTMVDYQIHRVLADVARITGEEERWRAARLLNRLERLEHVTAYIRRWEEEHGYATDLPALLRWIRMRDMHERLALEQSDAVRLMTVHAAKGLEFPVVIVAGMNEHLFPHLHGDIEEERRLAYVAITRAKDRLVLTRARTRTVWPGKPPVETKPSRFLQEMCDGPASRVQFEVW